MLLCCWEKVEMALQAPCGNHCLAMWETDLLWLRGELPLNKASWWQAFLICCADRIAPSCPLNAAVCAKSAWRDLYPGEKEMVMPLKGAYFSFVTQNKLLVAFWSCHSWVIYSSYINVVHTLNLFLEKRTEMLAITCRGKHCMLCV